MLSGRDRQITLHGGATGLASLTPGPPVEKPLLTRPDAQCDSLTMGAKLGFQVQCNVRALCRGRNATDNTNSRRFVISDPA
jgi:hypothetical protein